MKPIQFVNGAVSTESDSLVMYLREINKVPLLTEQEECTAIEQYRKGDMNAFEKIIRANLRFVVAVARRYQYQGIGLNDLISEGNLGLMQAINHYDETKGFKFISYAIWWIRQSIFRALNEYSRIIRLPRNKVASLYQITRAFKQLEQKFERQPTFEELSNLSGIEAEAIKTIMVYKVKQISIDAPVEPDEAKSLLDIIEDENAELPDKLVAKSESLESTIRISLGVLNKNQSEVVKMYYGIDGEEEMNHRQISEKLNVSSERIRQIKDAALIRIRKSHHCQSLKKCMA